MTTDYVNYGGIYFKKDQVKDAFYGGGLNGTHNVTLKNGSLFSFKQQPESNVPKYILDGFPDASRASIVIEKNGSIRVNKCNLDGLYNCKGKKDTYLLDNTTVNNLNLEMQDEFVIFGKFEYKKMLSE